MCRGYEIRKGKEGWRRCCSHALTPLQVGESCKQGEHKLIKVRSTCHMLRGELLSSRRCQTFVLVRSSWVIEAELFFLVFPFLHSYPSSGLHKVMKNALRRLRVTSRRHQFHMATSSLPLLAALHTRSSFVCSPFNFPPKCVT